MKYGHFDDPSREYVIDRVDTPVSWTNYIGTRSLAGVFNQTAGGYLFYKSPEYNRITRFRPNGVPLDRPGHYVYIRDDADGSYWTVSWQPVGIPLDKARYECRHGLSYIKYLCDYTGIDARQTLFVPVDDEVEIIEVTLKNNSKETRRLSIFGYAEFSFHHIDMDNKNFQMSLYSCGSSFKDGVIEFDPFYEDGNEDFFTAIDAEGGAVDGRENYDALRDSFIGAYRSESNPIAVESGVCGGSSELGGNHAGALRVCVELEAGEEKRVAFLLGPGNRATGRAAREKYAKSAARDAAFKALAAFWDAKLAKLQVKTPSAAFNTMTNIWTLYQSEVNVAFSRFASFIETGGRVGLGYRDTAQDAMCIPHSAPENCKMRLLQLLQGLTTSGYGLHLFQPEWFEPAKAPSFKSPTVVPSPDKSSIVHGLKDVCADDALWLVPAVCEYIRESGVLSFANFSLGYADTDQKETVYDHLKKILDFSAEHVGQNGVCQGLRADWNDCLNLGGGESAMVSFLHYWALTHFVTLAEKLGNTSDAAHYKKMAENVRKTCEDKLWNGEWYSRGVTKSGRFIGTPECAEGKVFMESNTWAVLSGAASAERGVKAMDAVDKYLYTPWGLELCAPAFSAPDDEVGFVTRVYKGLKENAAIFSHPNPWSWGAEAALGRGGRAMKFFDALCPYNQNDKIETRLAEPYVYCQFVAGREHSAHGRAHHPFMTGSAGWAYFASTRYILGIRPDYDALIVDPCIPPTWASFEARRVFRGALYNITVENPSGVEKGVKSVFIDGKDAHECVKDGKAALPVLANGAECKVRVVM